MTGSQKSVRSVDEVRVVVCGDQCLSSGSRYSARPCVGARTFVSSVSKPGLRVTCEHRNVVVDHVFQSMYDSNRLDFVSRFKVRKEPRRHDTRAEQTSYTAHRQHTTAPHTPPATSRAPRTSKPEKANTHLIVPKWN